MLKCLLSDLGLTRCRPFLGDRHFVLALTTGAAVLLGLRLFFPGLLPRAASPALLLSLLLWQPLLEELLFRGVIQWQLRQAAWGRLNFAGISCANWATSALFALAHGVTHEPPWAAAMLLPSLLFGHMRERFASVYPALALHISYNAGYFLL